MILKGLPKSFKPFIIHVTQSEETTTFTDFKCKLRSYEETEKMRETAAQDYVMKARAQSSQKAQVYMSDRRSEGTNLICFGCGQRGHKSKTCYCKKWWNFCQSSTHCEKMCRRKQRQDEVQKESAARNTLFRLSEAGRETISGKKSKKA